MTPADVIENTIRRQPQSDAHTLARAIATDLSGHGMLAERPAGGRRATKTTDGPRPRCERPYDPHSGTELNAAGNCPICGWRPDP